MYMHIWAGSTIVKDSLCAPMGSVKCSVSVYKVLLCLGSLLSSCVSHAPASKRFLIAENLAEELLQPSEEFSFTRQSHSHATKIWILLLMVGVDDVFVSFLIAKSDFPNRLDIPVHYRRSSFVLQSVLLLSIVDLPFGCSPRQKKIRRKPEDHLAGAKGARAHVYAHIIYLNLSGEAPNNHFKMITRTYLVSAGNECTRLLYV